MCLRIISAMTSFMSIVIIIDAFTTNISVYLKEKAGAAVMQRRKLNELKPILKEGNLNLKPR